jgi:hypothetical protein
LIGKGILVSKADNPLDRSIANIGTLTKKETIERIGQKLR